MRIPISVVDLHRKHGFNRIAKKLQNNWPGASPLTLYHSHQILSQGFGYRDFYTLQNSATSDAFVSDRPSHDRVRVRVRVRDNLCTAIHMFCQSQRIVDIDDMGVSRLVNMLPLQELLVFQAPNYVRAKTITLPSPPTLPPLPDLSEVIQSTIYNGDFRPSEMLEREASASSGLFISSAEFDRVWETMQRQGSLREQSLFMLAVCGLRYNELRVCTGQSLSQALNGFELLFTANKSRNQPIARMFLYDGVAAVLATYMAQEKISPGDFLFPSSRDRSVAISPHEMNRVLARYFGETMVSPSLRSVSAIRRSAALLAKKSDS